MPEWNRSSVIPKTRIDVTPDTSEVEADDEVKTEKKLQIEIDEDIEIKEAIIDPKQLQIEKKPAQIEEKPVEPSIKEPEKKRGTVIHIPKPVDERKQCFKTMLIKNDELENALERKPVYAFENSYRDIDEDKQVTFWDLFVY